VTVDPPKPDRSAQPDEADREGSGEGGPPTSRSSQISGSFPSADSDPDGDTLLSAPAPAQRWETDLEDRLATARRRIDDLEARVRALEANARPTTRVELPRAAWWVAFLVLLALIWQLVAWLRRH
jgi:hypothetical protein